MALRLIATLHDEGGTLVRVSCDHHQNFLFEHTRDGALTQAFFCLGPESFHRQVHALSMSCYRLEWARDERSTR